MMGAGKSTVAKALVKALPDYTLIDIDTEIENLMGMSISQIFDRFGENEFRRIESAVINDIEPNEIFTESRIDKVRTFTSKSDMVSILNEMYSDAENYTKEVVFFVEQVTGHIIPDFRFAIKHGIDAVINKAKENDGEFYRAAEISLNSAKILINRYIDLINLKKEVCSAERLNQLEFMEISLKNISSKGASNLFEAMQLYLILWEIMCLEQAPNPYAFSLGNVDRLFEPYRLNLSREEAAELFCHFLVFYNVGDRSWAISQNVILSGRDYNGNDMTNTMTYAVMDAYFTMNLPQPILSVKLHKNTPKKLYEEMEGQEICRKV